MDALKAAFADFNDALEVLLKTQYDLMAVAPSPEKDKHLTRCRWTLAQVESVQQLTATMGSALRAKNRRNPIKLPKHAHEAAYYTLRGGCTLLSAVAFSARQFIDRTENPDAPPLMEGMLNSINWAGLGKLLGIVEEGIRHGR